MAKFAKPETQAEKLAKNLYKHKIIKSLGTARSYKTALIKIKNPNEYYQKLLTHNSLKLYKDYLPR